MSQATQKFVVRLPVDLHEQIRKAAEAAGRSMHAELIARLQRPQLSDSGLTKTKTDQTPEQIASFVDAIKSAPSYVPGGLAGLRALPPCREGSRRVDMLGGVGLRPDGVFFNPLAGQSWVLSGQIPGMTRDNARRQLLSYGAQVSGGASEDTFALVAGEFAADRKVNRARELGVRIISGDEFVAMSKLFQYGEFPA